MRSTLIATLALMPLAGCHAATATVEQKPRPAAAVHVALPSPSVALATVAAPSCKKVRVTTPRKLIPDRATMVGELDVHRLIGSSLLAAQRKAMESSADGKKAIKTLRKCGLGIDDFRSVVMGGDEHGMGVVIVQGKGLGDVVTLECLARESKQSTPPKVHKTACMTEIEMSGGDHGFVVGRDTVVLASDGWVGDVEGRIAGKGRSALDGGMSWVRGRVDVGRPMWFAGRVPSSAKSGLSGTPFSGLTEFGGALNLTSGLELKLSGGFGSGSDAEAALNEVEKQFNSVRGMAGMVGVPQTVVDSIRFRRSGRTVEMNGFISKSDLAALQKIKL